MVILVALAVGILGANVWALRRVGTSDPAFLANARAAFGWLPLVRVAAFRYALFAVAGLSVMRSLWSADGPAVRMLLASIVATNVTALVILGRVFPRRMPTD